MTEAAIRTAYGHAVRRPRNGPWRALTPLAWTLWGATVMSATVLLGAALAALPHDAASWHRFGVLTIAASLAQLASVHLSRNRVFHPAIMFVLAGVLLLSPQQLFLMCLVQHLAEWLRKRYAWYIQPFNIGNYVLAAGASKVVLDRLTAVHLSVAVAGSVAAVAFIAVNRVLLLLMLRFARQLRAGETGLLRPDDVALELVLALMGIPLALLVADGPSAAALALAPLLLVSIAQRSAHGLEQATATIQEQNQQLSETNAVVISRSTAALEALSATVDARDSYTAGHSRRVREIAVTLGNRLGLDQEALDVLAQAALLHDIGKIAVPDSVLLKDGPLDRNDWLLMRAHSEEGARIIERLGYLNEVVPAIRHHHERVDGGGYPDGLIGNDIPLPARIIHVADSLDAMLTRRVYRDSLDFGVAVAEIRRGSGTDFCASCVAAFEAALEAGELESLRSGDDQ